MRDIWQVPPGSDKAAVRKPGRPKLKAAIAGTLVALLGIGGGALYASMKRSTAVDTDTALAEFRSATRDRDGSETRPQKTNERGRDRDMGRSSSSRGQSSSSSGRNRSGGDTDRVVAAAGRAGDGASTERGGRERSDRTVDFGRPAEGVYTWTIQGYEQGPGVRRELPRRSSRVITHEGGDRWLEHHIFSEQKESWFHLGSSSEGVAVSRVRNRVEMGPVEVDKTVVYDPPAFVSVFPYRLGQTWKGSWSGKTSGSYNGRTIDHGTMTIDGERIEVWVAEVVMRMRGEVAGQVITRSWVSMEHKLVVKQYQKTDVESGPGAYRSEWTGQVVSLEPRT